MHATFAAGDLLTLVSVFYFFALFILSMLGGVFLVMLLVYGGMVLAMRERAVPRPVLVPVTQPLAASRSLPPPRD